MLLKSQVEIKHQIKRKRQHSDVKHGMAQTQ